jgi:hypothetical protein
MPPKRNRKRLKEGTDRAWNHQWPELDSRGNLEMGGLAEERARMSTVTNSEPAIWGRLLDAPGGVMEPGVARYFLSLDFSDEDRKRMNELSEKAREGTLNDDEREQLESFNHVSHSLALLQSKARKCLKSAGMNG